MVRGLAFEELAQTAGIVDDVFARVIAPRITTDPPDPAREREERSKLTEFEWWQKYRRVLPDRSRPVPPGHDWWSLVPSATVQHAPDWGGLEHETDSALLRLL